MANTLPLSKGINSTFFRIFPIGFLDNLKFSGSDFLKQQFSWEWLVEFQWNFVRILAQLVFINSDTKKKGIYNFIFYCRLWLSTTVHIYHQSGSNWSKLVFNRSHSFFKSMWLQLVAVYNWLQLQLKVRFFLVQSSLSPVFFQSYGLDFKTLTVRDTGSEELEMYQAQDNVIWEPSSLHIWIF